jgi:hypothetical protein
MIYCASACASKQFFNNKNWYKILPFKVRSSIISPRQLASEFIFDFFIPFYVGSGSITPLRNRNLIRSRIVHYGSGSARQKLRFLRLQFRFYNYGDGSILRQYI